MPHAGEHHQRSIRPAHARGRTATLAGYAACARRATWRLARLNQPHRTHPGRLTSPWKNASRDALLDNVLRIPGRGGFFPAGTGRTGGDDWFRGCASLQRLSGSWRGFAAASSWLGWTGRDWWGACFKLHDPLLPHIVRQLLGIGDPARLAAITLCWRAARCMTGIGARQPGVANLLPPG